MIFDLRPGKKLPIVKIPLLDKGLTLEDVVHDLKSREAGMVHEIEEHQLNEFRKPWELDNRMLYEIIPVFLNEQDKGRQKNIHMIFTTHGTSYYCPGDVLTHYPLNDAHFFETITLQNPADLPKNSEEVRIEYEISTAPNAILEWTFQFNYEAIFSAFHLDGSGDLAGFVGFFFLKEA